MKNINDVTRLDRTHVRRLSRLYASAFFDDPDVAYILPDKKKRIKKLKYLFRFAASYGVLYGEAYSSSEKMEGCAIWLSSEYDSISLRRILKAGFLQALFRLGPRTMFRLIRTLNLSAAMHDKYILDRHWLLYLIAVRPGQQGKGHAGALLDHMIRRLEAERLPCILDTCNRSNITLYERFGFRLAHHSVLPRTSLDMWSMIKQ